MRKMAVALLMVLNFGSVLWAAGTEPTGSPRQVSTREHLLWICTNSSSWGDDFIQTADIVFTQEDFENGGAFYNVGAGFSPIGNNGTKFTGSYDGQEFSIEGLLINRTSDYIGLFGWISDATIQNLSVTSVDISGGTFVGGLVGVNTVSATISNCSTSGRVTGTGDYVGGLIGYSNAIIENSSSVCQVIGNSYIGGLVGSNDVTVSRCYSCGEVTGNQHAGGLVGYNTSTIDNSFCVGSVIRASGSTSESLGDFVGYNYNGVVAFCYSTGSVSYNSAENPTDKGFIGEQAGSGNSYANNFFDSTASNQSSDAVGSATPKTTVEMKNVRTFTDVEWSLGLSFAWDFETNPYDDEANNNYWDLDLDGIINNGYPYLSWEDGADVSLPVVLVNFTADQSRDGVVLRWTTESEIENLGFIICRKCKVSPTGVPEGKSSKWEEIASYLTDAALQGQGSTAEKHDYQYIDFAVQPGMTYEYRLSDVDFGGKVTWCAGAEIRIKVGDAPVATEFGLQKTFPNPFNANVTLCYNLSDNGKTNLAVYNLRGQLVATLVNVDKTKGTYQVNWQPRQLSTGIYIVRLESGARTTYRKIEYVK
ncbi:MAG: T9SS type A sorting domain-containing protein [Fidelibacterota bacterium]